MSSKVDLRRDAPVIWVREGRGGPGYGERALARVTRTNSDGRVTITVYREDDNAWVLRSVGADELQRPAADEIRRIEDLEMASDRVARAA
ncbi:MAG TPA: hypothetical protein VFQ88_02980 [Nevskiaceae bacterium]|nr:hypothetical protein [Nevskiaceae bacterium]